MRFLLKLLMGLAFSACALADQTLGLPPLGIPTDNPQSVEKIELGRLLFNDKRFSADSSVSCASCHHPDKAFTDGLLVAKGIKGQTGVRNSPTLVNAAFFETLFVDGRASSLEDQALGPLMNPIEHGLKTTKPLLMLLKVMQLTPSNSVKPFPFKQTK